MTTTSLFHVDPAVEAFNDQVYNTPLIQDVWRDKYYNPKLNETSPSDVYIRVAKAIGSSPAEKNKEKSTKAAEAFYELMQKRLFLPGGRILAGAGTDKRVTLMNCYVNSTLDDSMEGIMAGVSNLALTSQQGGGMGTAFETLRPSGAILKRTQSAASGILPFMDVFSQTGKTIRSAGERRAAQMGTISDTHPDLPEFIQAKGKGLLDGTMRLSEFNISVLISDAFMGAIDDDEEWPLYFSIPPVARVEGMEEFDFDDDEGVRQYVYSVWHARDLWKLITENTYEYSDPGTIFIDRINELNNLSYVETIRCTNPCGEQPLPPNGTCNLGAINVANVIRKPFASTASIDYVLLAEVAKWGVRFLDNVIDVTGYPLEAQREEEFAKRRIGLGLLGLGTLFSQLCIRYGSQQSVQVAEKIMKTIALAAYDASMELAAERGSFPLFQDIIIDCGFIKVRLDDDRKAKIKATGLRNGVILTIAPVGTGSIAFGNVSSGLEPDFALEQIRRVRQNNTEEFREYVEKSYTKRFYEFCTGNTDVPDYMVTALSLDILDHIKVQAACQKWVDASVSKTINIPQEMPYDKFLEVYQLAYSYGCKGCTTYRPNDLRASILVDANGKKSSTSSANSSVQLSKVKRNEILEGSTYKIKWPSLSASMYVTINYSDDKPYEIFFASKDAKFQDWMTGITLMISSILRSGVDPKFIPHELKQVKSTHDTTWHNGKFYGSLVARIGSVIEDDFIRKGVIQTQTTEIAAPSGEKKSEIVNTHSHVGDICPSCTAPTYYHLEGCKKCTSCGFSAC